MHPTKKSARVPKKLLLETCWIFARGDRRLLAAAFDAAKFQNANYRLDFHTRNTVGLKKAQIFSPDKNFALWIKKFV